MAGCAVMSVINPFTRHSIALFDEGLDVRILRQPVLRANVETRILNGLFEFDALLAGHGSDAELEPA